MGNLVLQIITGNLGKDLIYECEYLDLPLYGMSESDIKDEVNSYLKNNIEFRCCNVFDKKSLPYDGKNVNISFKLNGTLLYTKDIFIDRGELMYYLKNKKFSERQLTIFISKHVKYKWIIMDNSFKRSSLVYA